MYATLVRIENDSFVFNDNFQRAFLYRKFTHGFARGRHESYTSFSKTDVLSNVIPHNIEGRIPTTT